jgi:hypothetical protein
MENIPMRNSALKAIADKRVAQENGVKSIDPVIKKTQTVDPETGSITYKHSWNSSSESKTPSTTKSRGSSPTISSVGSKKTTVAPKKTTTTVSKTTVNPGSREFSSVAPLTPKTTTVDTKPTAAIPTEKQLVKVAPPTKEQKYRATWEKSYQKTKKPGETFEQWNQSFNDRVNKNSAKNRRFDWLKGDGGIIDTGKNKSGACKTCH